MVPKLTNMFKALNSVPLQALHGIGSEEWEVLKTNANQKIVFCLTCTRVLIYTGQEIETAK